MRDATAPRQPGNTRGRKWNGPAGLSPAEKKAWSERRRQKNLTRTQRQAQNANRRKNWPAKAERRAARRFRFSSPIRFRHDAGCAIVTAETLKRPPLLFIDASGRLWREDTRSARQLIRDWQKGHRHEKPRKKGSHTTPS